MTVVSVDLPAGVCVPVPFSLLRECVFFPHALTDKSMPTPLALIPSLRPIPTPCDLGHSRCNTPFILGLLTNFPFLLLLFVVASPHSSGRPLALFFFFSVSFLPQPVEASENDWEDLILTIHFAVSVGLPLMIRNAHHAFRSFA